MAGYSPTPLAKKLGIKPGTSLALDQAPPGWAVPDLPDDVVAAAEGEPADVIVAFFRESAELPDRLPGLARRIFPAGGLWLPSFVLPGWARDVSLSLPTTWAMRGLDGVTWQGRDLFGSLPSVSVVAGFTAVFLAVAVAKLVSSEARRRRGMA